MSKHTCKQRMKRRLIEAIVHADPDLEFELAVMGYQHRFWTYTHKALKQELNRHARSRYSDGSGTYCYDAQGGRILVRSMKPLRIPRT